jgi:hypothetical protein
MSKCVDMRRRCWIRRSRIHYWFKARENYAGICGRKGREGTMLTAWPEAKAEYQGQLSAVGLSWRYLEKADWSWWSLWREWMLIEIASHQPSALVRHSRRQRRPAGLVCCQPNGIWLYSSGWCME